MWDQKAFELFTNIIPQAFVVLFIYFSLTNIKIRKTYIIFSMVFALVTFFIRPYVNFGVHSIITLIVLILIAVLFCKADIITSIIYGIATYAISYLCEWATFAFLKLINFNLNLLDTNVQIRTAIGLIPMFLLLFVGILIKYTKLKFIKKVESKDDVV